MTVLVTGGNAGIGYFVAEQLAEAGVEVVLGSRDAAKAEVALRVLRERVPGARASWARLDLADLASVNGIEVGGLDAVVLNAGVRLEGPQRRETRDGHEMSFGVNHLGHFALTAALQDRLRPGARIVTMGSFAAKSAKLDFADLESKRDYQPKTAYERSKLAQTLFALELDRRLRAAGSSRLSVVAHPGGALDRLTPDRPPLHVRGTKLNLARIALQGKDGGARPAVRAAVGPDVHSGQIWGPRVFGLKGKPRPEPVRGPYADAEAAARVWAASAELTGVEPVFS
ncbi:SDR family NAD(P)-dependent oxidoreductase [Amycolatopsis rubida]|uniref:SDR family NAD(P)-dependent oxidoreductase n=1 Tax=Amycolatopsis rubida TaxID=112413 RepID=A0ABX0BSQ2_9PSEU|nr:MULTISPECIES: SDR family NAD(P)-dependent oxidoreductase [Amycolatopsis]MYW91734.1 SDR family NAD(P)-dependent oxidoreductase [Amycolatopsis rubida]NEC56718.1 SDR family NAD(P)-dependent oxidoreductase [Amycolatopsis rubida]OAP20734.1 short chain dehydrogenase [Amycolatopsis sp. M39]